MAQKSQNNNKSSTVQRACDFLYSIVRQSRSQIKATPFKCVFALFVMVIRIIKNLCASQTKPPP